MNLEEIHYDAFISYRHAPLDSFVAQNIHKRLEAFKVPGYILKTRPELKDGLKRVFRDEEELPLATNLSDPITAALKNSRFLIVICTPRLLESKWCMKEIDTFIEMHGRDKVLAVLAEGEPEESFPKQLLSREVVKIDSNGNEITVTEEVEPLAADVRGANEREIIRNMKDDILRLAAAMLGLNFDDLKRRHHERKMRKTIGICAAVTSVFAVFGAVSFTQAVRINNQAKEIETQNENIMAQNEEIKAQNEEIKAQNEEIEAKSKEISEKSDVITEKYLTAAAQNVNALLTEGRIEDAREALDGAVAEAGNNELVVTNPKMVLAMTNVKHPYSLGSDYAPILTYNTAAAIEEFKFSDDFYHLLALDEADNLYVWDTQTGEKEFEVGRVSSDLFSNCDFLNDDEVIYSTMEGTYTYSLSNKKTKEIVKGLKSVRKIAFDEYKVFEKGIHGDCVNAIKSHDSDAILAIYKDSSDDNLYAGVSIKDEEVFTDLEAQGVKDIKYADGRFYICSYAWDDIYITSNWGISCISAEDGSLLWKKEYDDTGFARKIDYYEDGDNKFLCANTQKAFMIFDAETGALLNGMDSPSEIVTSFVVDDQKCFVGILDDAHLVIVNLKGASLFDVTDYSVEPQKVVKNAYFFGGNIFLQFKGENYLVRYNAKASGEMEQITKEEYDKFALPYEEMYSNCEIYSVKPLEYEEVLRQSGISPEVVANAFLSDDGKYLTVNMRNGEAKIVDLQTNAVVTSVECQYSLPYALTALSNNRGYLLLIFDKKNLLLDDNMNVIARASYCFGYDEEQNRLIFTDNDNYYANHYYSGEELLEMK